MASRIFNNTNLPRFFQHAENILVIQAPEKAGAIWPTTALAALPKNDLLNRPYTLCPGNEAYPSKKAIDVAKTVEGGMHLKHSAAENVRTHGVKTTLDKRQKQAGYQNITIDEAIRTTNTLLNDEDEEPFSSV